MRVMWGTEHEVSRLVRRIVSKDEVKVAREQEVASGRRLNKKDAKEIHAYKVMSG